LIEHRITAVTVRNGLTGRDLHLALALIAVVRGAAGSLREWLGSCADRLELLAWSARVRRLCSCVCTCDNVLSSVDKRVWALLELVTYWWLCARA